MEKCGASCVQHSKKCGNRDTFKDYYMAIQKNKFMHHLFNDLFCDFRKRSSSALAGSATTKKTWGKFGKEKIIHRVMDVHEWEELECNFLI